MKKLLLASVALVAAMTVNAQEECWMTDNSAYEEKSAVEALTVFGESENVTFMAAYADSYAQQNPKCNDYTTLTVNGVDITVASTGVQGNTNPTHYGLLDAPSAGAVYRFDVKKDGYLIIPSKYSVNKNYYVFEGLYGAAPEAVAYTLACEGTALGGAGTLFTYTLVGDEWGYVDLEAEGNADLITVTAAEDGSVSAATMNALRVIYGNADLTGNIFGVVIFPVYAEAGSYLFCATGSKATCAGAIFVEDELESIVASGDGAETVTLYGEATDGIKSITSVANESNEAYNLAGQRVAATAKGIVIVNGKKVVNL